MNDEYVILADPACVGWNFALDIFEDLKSRGGNFELSPIKIKEFRDGEIKPRIEKNVRGKSCFFIHDSNKDPSRWFLEIGLINQALEKSSAKKVIDVFPYHRFARQDRKDESRVPISAGVVARLVDEYVDSVLTLDVHNPAIDGFYKTRFDNLLSFPIVIRYLRENFEISSENTVMMSPDAGGATRAQEFARRMGIEQVVIGYKVRKIEGEVDKLRISGEVSGKDVFIVDDIVDSGGTLVKASSVVREQGARKVYGYCTHGLFTKGIEYVLPHFDAFFVGDTLKQKEDVRLKVVPFAPLFAEAIYRISNGSSLSELFD